MNRVGFQQNEGLFVVLDVEVQWVVGLRLGLGPWGFLLAVIFAFGRCSGLFLF